MLTRLEILRTLAEQRSFLLRHGVKRLGLFGSYSREKASDASDIDFLVEFEKPTFDGYMDLKFFLEDTFLHKVDLVLLPRLKPRIRENILRQTRYVSGL